MPDEESFRLAVLRSYGMIDTPREETFDRLTRLAARLFGVPITMIALMDAERQWFKSSFGVDICETSREIAFCAQTVATGEMVVSPDTLDDPRFANHPFVAGEPHIRFYAGAPLRVPQGVTLGTICLLDTKPREFSDADRAQLQDLAEMVVDEMKLHYNERLYRALVEGGSEMVTIFDEKGAVTYQSPSIKRLLGYEPDELTGDEMYDLIHPDDQAEVSRRHAHMRAIKRDITPHNFRCLKKNGEWCVLECYTRYRMDDPQIGGIVSIARDVTERVQIEKKLSWSEGRFEAMFEQSSIGLALLQIEGHFIRINDKFAELTGFDVARVTENHYRDLLHPDDVESTQQKRQGLLNGDVKSVHSDRRLRHVDGTYRWAQFNVTMVHDSLDGPGYILIQLQDIDARKQQEERLRLLESVAVNAHDAILITEAEPIDDPGPRILYANEAHHRMSGYSLEEMLGKSPRMMQGQDTDPEVRAKIRQSLKRWKPIVTEVLNYRKDGTPYWAELSIVPVADETGWYTHWVSIQRDINARKESEATLIRTREEAEAARLEAETANTAKSEFLSRMSHELRTPLNAILGFGQLLEMEEQSPHNRESTEQILKAGRHLLELINEVLDISRIESGRMAMSLEPVNVAEVARETLDLVRSMAAQYGVSLRENGVFDSPLSLVGDRRRVKQVLLNLLSNAIKYNRKGGQVTLSIETNEATKRVRLCVTDTGAGIAPEKRERLWVPFDRLDAETTGIEGTGIGLALSHRLAQAMEGELDYRSTSNGSTFWLELPTATPLSLASPESAADIVPSMSPAVSTRWVALYIEDNLPNVQLVQGILARRPEVRLLTAFQGALGVELAEQHCPDVILLDLHLPDINGDEVLRRLRQNPATRDIPVVMISADATPGQIDRLLKVGANDYLSKPFDIGHFLSVLDGCIALRGGASDRARQNSDVALEKPVLATLTI